MLSPSWRDHSGQTGGGAPFPQGPFPAAAGKVKLPRAHAAHTAPYKRVMPQWVRQGQHTRRANSISGTTGCSGGTCWLAGPTR
eukprot:6521476-Prymnesium_polylepis.1